MSRYLDIAHEAVDKHGAMQKPGELAALAEYLCTKRSHIPASVLEIGGMHGGTAWFWHQILKSPRLIVTVDLFVLEGRMELAEVPVRLVRGNSHRQSTLATVLETLGEQVDVLFIDGDHSYEGVRRDFEMYAPLVRPGGSIVLHDVSVEQIPSVRLSHDVVPFWNQLRSVYTTKQFYDDSESWGGIGVVEVPEHKPHVLRDSVVEIGDPTDDERIAYIPWAEYCQRCNASLKINEQILCATCAST